MNPDDPLYDPEDEVLDDDLEYLHLHVLDDPHTINEEDD